MISPSFSLGETEQQQKKLTQQKRKNETKYKKRWKKYITHGVETIT